MRRNGSSSAGGPHVSWSQDPRTEWMSASCQSEGLTRLWAGADSPSARMDTNQFYGGPLVAQTGGQSRLSSDQPYVVIQHPNYPAYPPNFDQLYTRSALSPQYSPESLLLWNPELDLTFGALFFTSLHSLLNGFLLGDFLMIPPPPSWSLWSIMTARTTTCFSKI